LSRRTHQSSHYNEWSSSYIAKVSCQHSLRCSIISFTRLYTRSWPLLSICRLHESCAYTSKLYQYHIIYILCNYIYIYIWLVGCKRFSSTTASHSSIASLLVNSTPPPPRTTPSGGRRAHDAGADAHTRTVQRYGQIIASLNGVRIYCGRTVARWTSLQQQQQQ